MVGEVTFAVIGLLLLIADVRTFASTFQLTYFGQSNTQLALMATAVFATSFIAPLVGWQLGPRRSVALSGAILGIATLLATVARYNWADLGLSIAGLAGGMWWLALLHASRPPERPSPFPIAIPIAFVGDVTLRALFRTVPFVDINIALAAPGVLVATLLFLAAGVAALGGPRAWARPNARGALALIALPALFFVAETGGTNGAQTALASGIGLGPEPARSTQLGMLLTGLGLAAGTLTLSRDLPRGIAAAVACVAGAVLLWYVHSPVVSLVGGLLLAAGVALAAASIPAAPLVAARSPVVVSLTLALGWLVFVGTAFGFYAYWAYLPAVYAATALVAVAGLLVPGRGLAPWRLLPIALVPIVVGVPLLALLLTPAPPTLAETRNSFRIMTFNIHQGFSAGQVPSLDQIVNVISSESPDVLVLQEVARGWMIDEQHDALGVLAERLGMQYVFGPNIGDLYGNAILSRSPMTDVRRIRFAPQPSARHQPRGAVGVRIGDIVVVTTHLDEIPDSSAIRQEQVRAILREWAAERVAVIAGDMNADPSDPEMGLFSLAGYEDLAEPAGSTTTMDDPQRRIDYVWGIGVTGSSPHTVMALGASDHRAVVVNVRSGGP
ncbi:MAG TPA: endonuclease/exonuclease/phosphatase family protein [Candidatus Limnocylindria bacterium]|nr:endonuclease/exonuclease/phosphatase family protein [Candidatus Limnocylindria bacterium]